jgi:serine/threonine-protein kinase SRPK3
MSENSNISSSIDYNNSYTSSESETCNNLDLAGEIINNYNVITLIGKGSYSRVWLVYCIGDNNYYALKVQNPEDYDEGKYEISVLKKIPSDANYINKLKDYFIETRIINNKQCKFICSVYDLCSGNLDGMCRKGKYKNGYPINLVKKMFRQILEGLNVIHTKLNGFHGDIKPDNILLCGLNNRDTKYISMYNRANFNSIYSNTKKEYCDAKKIKTLDSKKKYKIRQSIHKTIIEMMEENTENPYMCDDKYIDNPIIKITDFGFFCHKSEKFNESFGTRYYMAPEIILMNECNEKVDIWALGCMLYELVTGEILFDPEGDEDRSTNSYHLEMMINLCGNFKRDNIKYAKNYNKYFKNNRLIDMKVSNDNSSTFDKINNKLKAHNINDHLLAKYIETMLKLTPYDRASLNDLLRDRWLYI